MVHEVEFYSAWDMVQWMVGFDDLLEVCKHYFVHFISLEL